MANANVIPPDAEKLLFAVDFVRFFLNKRHPSLSFELKTDVAKLVEIYRPHVRQHFNTNIRNIIAEIDETQSVIVRREFLEIQTQGGMNESSLREYTDSFKDCVSAKGFRAGNFLIYCSRVALMASFFFANGRKDALDIAVDKIRNTLPEGEEECRLVWDNLENAALKFASDSQREAGSHIFRSEQTDQVSSETEESSNSSTATSESDSNSENQKLTSGSSEESLNALVVKLNNSSMECINYVESKSAESTSSTDTTVTPVSAAENFENSIQNPSVSSSTFTIPKIDIDMAAKFKEAFREMEAEPSQPNTTGISPKTSCLGKRPSPRKVTSPSHLRGNTGDDSETETKKAKLVLPESTEKYK